MQKNEVKAYNDSRHVLQLRWQKNNESGAKAKHSKYLREIGSA